MRQTADSASAQAAQKPPPAWLDRLAPGASTRYSNPTSNNSPALNAFIMIWGMAFAVCFFGSLIGTLGWIGSMLLAFSASGRWFGKTPVVAIESENAN
jgi:hypothetical protein